MSHKTSAHISIVAPHEIQAEILRIFKMPAAKMRQALGALREEPVTGRYLPPEMCIDHINIYYIDGDSPDSWRFDIAMVMKKFPEVKVYYSEMTDEGKAGAVTNDTDSRFFSPYSVMVANHPDVARQYEASLPEIRRVCSEIWTKQNNGFKTSEEADNFVANMHRTFPDLSAWIRQGSIEMWTTHFVPEVFDAEKVLHKP